MQLCNRFLAKFLENKKFGVLVNFQKFLNEAARNCLPIDVKYLKVSHHSLRESPVFGFQSSAFCSRCIKDVDCLPTLLSAIF